MPVEESNVFLKTWTEYYCILCVFVCVTKLQVELKSIVPYICSCCPPLQTSKDPGISAFPKGDNLFEWIGTIGGTAGTVCCTAHGLLGCGDVNLVYLGILSSP